MSLVGGVPIPEDSIKGTKVYIESLEKLLKLGRAVHVYSEGSMWEGYMPIRPFKRGAAFFACKFDKPILPLSFSYRKPGFIRSKIFRQYGTFTLSIGTPLYKNPELSGKAQVDDLNKRCHEEVCKLAGINPSDNIYPQIFENNKRIDYYASKYGEGYKGSW